MFRLNPAPAGLALLLMGCLGIQRPATEPGSGRPDAGPGSGYRGYAWTEAREIPDGDRQGILIGPVVTATADDGSSLGPLALRLDIRHPAMGDLDIRLAYDADGDGNPEAQAPVEFFRSRPDIQAPALHACPISLEGAYFFRDGTDFDDAVFARFDGLPRGHAFYLAVADTLGEFTGTVEGWAVYLERSGAAGLR